MALIGDPISFFFSMDFRGQPRTAALKLQGWDWKCIGDIYRDNGKEHGSYHLRFKGLGLQGWDVCWGYIKVTWVLYGDNGKENGNYYTL